MADTLESLEIEVKHSASGAADEIKKVSSSIRSLGKALEKTLPSFKMFKDLMGGSLSINDNSMTQVADTINNVRQASASAGKASKNAASGVKALGKEASASKKPLETIISSLKRIAFYRFIRSIIKSIGQAFSEGLEKAYLFSSGVIGEGNRFAAAMDRMKSSGNAMTGQLGSAFISLLAAIEPILTKIIDLITRVIDAISQLFAAFT